MQFFHFFVPSAIIAVDDNSTAIVPIYNLPNLKQKQKQNDGVEAALTIYGIVLDAKAHQPRPKESTVSEFVFIFDDYCCLFISLILFYFIDAEIVVKCCALLISLALAILVPYAQVLVKVCYNHKLLGKIKVFDRLCNL